MNLNDFSKEVHENAVAHGWWEADRSFAECICLIHSEWSEALEEARAGRPMLWYECLLADRHTCDFENTTCCLKDRAGCDRLHRGRKKPEGIAVEIIDGVIRILDLFGRYSYNLRGETVTQLEDRVKKLCFQNDAPLTDTLASLHYLTSLALSSFDETKDYGFAMTPLEMGAGIAIRLVRQKGLDPEKLLREKHEFNLTRPYKHGKKF